MPPLTAHFDPNSADDCIAGRVQCVKKTIQQMQHRFDGLAAACDHDAVFSLAYLRTTEAYLGFTQQSGFFSDPAFVNHEDAAFAQMYFNAYDAWAGGRLGQVPPAWRVALAAADSEQVSGSGDLLLGMNAHVNRDLPFLLAAIGLRSTSGESRKPDHDQVNLVLNHVVAPLIDEEAAHFDSQIKTIDTPYGVGYTGLMQTLIAWREAAWRQAERLVSAPDAASRAVIADEIEQYAATNAKAIVAASTYQPPVTTSAARNSYCAAF